jgi:predicted N-formylglutamate amidohydrolase
VLSCEHASAAVPRDLAPLFRDARAVLATHRGWDAGALAVSRSLARRLAVPLVAGRSTRLIVDLNRSAHNRSIFSEFTRDLPRAERAALIARFHAPHWARAGRMVDAARAPVVHVAVHSFTPKLHGQVRPLELGLLYDPRRSRERAFADALHAAIARRAPHLRIRRNRPYHGRSDGLPTAFRKARPARDYLGLELELNQATLRSPEDERAWAAVLAPSLEEALATMAGPPKSATGRAAGRPRRAAAKR